MVYSGSIALLPVLVRCGGAIVTDPIRSRTPLHFARGELVFGYRLVRKLGEGSFGSVWLAANEKGFEWALKLVSLQGSGGIKEFKALQLIKDRKINNTYLLKLIDYGLLDHEGNSLASSASPLDSGTTSTTLPSVEKPKPNEPPRATPQGTMMPAVKPASNQTAVEHLAARETQGPASDTKTAEKARAAWLVIVMEVGQQTLHQLQLQQTEREIARQPHRQTRAVTRMGMTAGGSKTIRDGNPAAALSDPLEEPLIPLPVATVLPYLEQAARGLDYLHRHEIVHRDIKPQNIILVGDDAKVCDYGLASESTNSTATTIGCTPAYAAPEAINNRPVPASDQYSLAVTYIELITGRWPFFGVTQTAIYREKDEGRHNLSFIRNRRSRAVLKRALAKLPQDRFPTCTEFAQQLAAAEKSSGNRWSPWQLVATALVLLLLTIAGFGWAYQKEWWPRKPIAVLPKPSEQPLEIPANEPDPGSAENSRPKATNDDKANTKPNPPTIVESPPNNKSADEILSAAFADAKLPPRDLLRVFETEVLNAADPTEWFLALRNKAEENSTVLTATEQWLQRNLNRTPRPESLDSSEYRAFDLELRAASLQRLFNRPLPTSADLESLLSSPALRLNDSHPLAVLLRVDCEMRLAESAATKAQLETWEGQIQSAQIPQLSGKLAAQRSLFLIYLNAVRFPARMSESDLRSEGERLQELLNTQPQPAWLTADRKQQLAEPLGLVALHELGKTDRDLLEIHRFQLNTNKRLANLLTIASLHQLRGNSLGAVQGVMQGSAAVENPNNPADWQAIGDLANQAFHDPRTNQLLATQQRRLLVYYLVKLAALRTAVPTSPEFRDAVKGFATLLATKQDNTPLYFDFQQAAQPRDTDLYRTLLEPVLGHAAIANQAPSPVDPASLAQLSAAKARLLQRSPAIAKLVSSELPADLGEDIRTLLVTHRAFEVARQYDKQAAAAGKPPAEYLATAHQETLATVSKMASDSKYALRDLLALVEAFDPSGSSSDAALLRVGAYVRRSQAYQEVNPQRRAELAREAMQRYQKCLPLAGPVGMQAASEMADLHLNLAAWTEFGKSDYEVLSETTQPPRDTKSFHLWQAADLARRAITMQSLTKAQRAEPFSTLALAHEQIAFTLGQLQHYGNAIDTCEQGLRAMDPKAVAANQLQAIKARCLLRHGQELCSELTESERQDKLQQAIREFETAIGDRRSTRQWQPHDAEALAFLADAHIALASEPERANRLTQAEAALRAAVEAADPRSPRLSHYRWRLLLVVSNQAGESNRPAQKLADEIFLAVEQNPADQDPAATFGMATATSRLFAEPSKLLRWLPAKGAWHDQWRSSDAWKLEAARLYAEAALASSLPDLRRTAQQLAFELPQRSSPRRQAEAYLQDNLARQLCREFERLKPPSSSASENSQRSYEADRQSKAGIATSAIRDCCQKHWDCQDGRIQSLLAEINRASLADLQAGKILPNATVLEKRALWKFVTSAPSLDARDKYLEICQQHGSLMTAGNDLNRQDLVQTTNELLKPVFYFTALAPREPALDAFLKRHKPKETEKKK